MTEVNHSNLPQVVATLFDRFDRLEALIELKSTNTTEFNPNERLTRKELSNQYKVCLATIHNLMRNGSLKYSKVGRKTLFVRADVESFFNKKRG